MYLQYPVWFLVTDTTFLLLVVLEGVCTCIEMGGVRLLGPIGMDTIIPNHM